MIIGTAGHIDHGKTSLVRALTGIDTDRLKDEKARGISIDLGFAYLPMPDGGVLGFVDVPGHEKFIHNMLAGATGIDFVLLAVAADDGVMPQTREHVAIIDLLGIRNGIVALTKADLATPSRLSAVGPDIRELLSRTALAKTDIVPVSTVTGDGIARLRERLFAAAHATVARVGSERFRLAIDRSFTLAGVGTVVTGTVLSGAVSIGDRVVISPSGLIARVRSIHAQNRPSERGSAGQRCALNLAGVSKDAIARGQVALDPRLHAPADRIDATLRMLAIEQKPATDGMPVRLHHAAAEVGARLALLSEGPIPPGGEGLVQLVLARPIAAVSGDRFVLRDTAAQRTIAGGRFLDLRGPARRRRSAERLAQLRAQGNENAEAALAMLLEMPPHHLDLTVFARDRALSERQMQAIGERVGIVKAPAVTSVFALSVATLLRLTRGLLGVVGAFHADNPELPGIGIEQLRVQLQPRLSPPAFLSILNRLVGTHDIAVEAGRVRLRDHQVQLTAADARSWSRLAPLLGADERFHPPRLRDLSPVLGLRDGELRRLFRLLVRIGKVDEVATDHFFLRTAIAEIVRVIVELSDSTEDGQFTAAQFRDRIGHGRQLAIQILEFLDRHSVTVRRGNLRRVNKPRLGLFDTGAESIVAEAPAATPPSAIEQA